MTRARALVVAVALVAPACASRAPATLDPQSVRVWQAAKAVAALGTVQHAAIELNAIERCDESGACSPLFSDRDTAMVISIVAPTVTAIGQAPNGWFSVADVALVEIADRLDEGGQRELAIYLQTARAVLAAIPREE